MFIMALPLKVRACSSWHCLSRWVYFYKLIAMNLLIVQKCFNEHIDLSQPSLVVNVQLLNDASQFTAPMFLNKLLSVIGDKNSSENEGYKWAGKD